MCATLAAPLWGAIHDRTFASEIRRYADASTELEVFRLTDPTFESILPGHGSRPISRRSNFLLYASRRTGSWQAFRMDLKNGQSRLLTDARELDPDSLTLAPDDHSFYFLDGGALQGGTLGGVHTREILPATAGSVGVSNVSVSDDNQSAAFIEKNDATFRLQVASLQRGTAKSLVESDTPIQQPKIRSVDSGSVAYKQGDELWVASLDGSHKRKLPAENVPVASAIWSHDGQTILYLNVPPKPGRSVIRECMPDGSNDRLVAATSQFADFGQNGDASVFVGAGGSKASPYVFLLLRSVKRELALCEHRSTDPAETRPAFSPDSQRVLFQSDRHGKMAIYSMQVERLVERTGEDTRGA